MSAIQLRDEAWVNSKLVPNWVRGREISLDQHNTPDKLAQYCWATLKKFIERDKKDITDYTAIEPSAGSGSFYDILPTNNRIGIDVEFFPSYADEYIQADFLTWNPQNKASKYIAIGNPPFGYRGWLALSFLNHAAEFCEYVGFILPMSFQSDGKGSPKHRVDNMTLIHSEILPDNLYTTNNGGSTNVNTMFQVWRKGIKNPLPDLSAANEYIELFTVDQRKERLCGVDKMKTCNIFLQRTYYTVPPSLVNDFSQVKYCCGYGINIKKDYDRVLEILNKADWNKYSNLATHNCRHISMYHIRQVLLDNI